MCAPPRSTAWRGPASKDAAATPSPRRDRTQREAVDGILLAANAVQLELARAALRPSGLGPGKHRPLLPQQDRQRDDGAASSTAYWAICVRLAERMPPAKLQSSSIATPRADARARIDGEDARGDDAQAQQRQGESGKGAQDDGEHGERPHARAPEPLAEKIGNGIAAELAQIRRQQERNRRASPLPPPSTSSDAPSHPWLSAPASPAKASTAMKQHGDRHAVEHGRHEPPCDVEVGDRPPQGDGAGPGVDRQAPPAPRVGSPASPASLLPRYRASRT